VLVTSDQFHKKKKKKCARWVSITNTETKSDSFYINTLKEFGTSVKTSKNDALEIEKYSKYDVLNSG
jgi:hypothetical protein